MALEIENKIETAWVALLEANTYIATNSIPVRRFRDCTNDKTDEMVVVRVHPVRNEFATGNLWGSEVEIMAVTFMANDRGQISLERIYSECIGVAKNSTIQQLTIAGSITFNGKTILENGAQLFDEEGIYQNYTVNIQCHVQE